MTRHNKRRSGGDGHIYIDWSDKTTAASDRANWRRIVDQ